MRKNSKAKAWIARKIAQLRKENYSQAQAVAIAFNEARKYKLIKNPEEELELKDSIEEAEQVASGFHGRENREIFEVEEAEIYRENLAYLGEMLDIEVFIECRNKLITLPFEDVMLGCSSDRNSLYFAGDTKIPLSWIKQNVPEGWDKDKVVIGWIYSISYFADKHHLTGPKQQKNGMEYIHCFGEQTFKAPASFEGIWKLKEKITRGVLPQLVYNRLGECCEIVGGVYSIKDEGIWD